MTLKWNKGGWFGGQLGSTAWILVAAILAGIRDISTGAVLLVLFGVPNIVGTLMWRRRNLSCYSATQALMALVGVCGLLAVYVLDRNATWERIQTGGSISASSAYFLIPGVIAVLMLTFYLRFGRDKAAR